MGTKRREEDNRGQQKKQKKMARRYDARTTIFSPEGRLYQVEYAMEAISHAGAAVGILGKDGVVLACEKKLASKLLEPGKRSEKMYRIDDHIACAVAAVFVRFPGARSSGATGAAGLRHQARLHTIRRSAALWCVVFVGRVG